MLVCRGYRSAFLMRADEYCIGQHVALHCCRRVYRCPNTGDCVRAWAADALEDDDLTYVQVTCLACAQAHLVSAKTGKVLGSDDE
jgi:hypothetical protein